MSDPNPSWRPVVGWEGFYAVSADGQVRSLPRKGSHGRTLKPGTKDSGHLVVALCRDGKAHTRMVHQLVLEAFTGPRPDPPPGSKRTEARHLDGNPANNAITNLVWGTSSENALDSLRHGTNPSATKTHCKRGHEFTPENTYTYKGRRCCRECGKERLRKFYNKRDIHAYKGH